MDYELQALEEKAFNSLRMELTNIHMEASKGKLKPTSARDLAVYIKLLKDLKEDKAKEEEIKYVARAKEILEKFNQGVGTTQSE